MAQIEVDVDLDDFDTYELLRELKSRIRRFGRKGLTESQLKELKADLLEANKELGILLDGIEIKTLEDKMKIEHLGRVWDKYTFYQLENQLPA